MSLKLFDTYLSYGRKVANLAFRKKSTNETFEAGFSRVDAGDTSGATVFRNGQLIELAEDEPDWDDLNGCPVLKIRPEAQNLEGNAGIPENWYNDVVIPSNEGAFELFPSYYWGKYTQVSASNNVGLFYSLFSGSENWVISFFVKISESNDYIGIRETGGGVGVVQFSTETVKTSGGGISSIEKIDTTDNDIKLIIVKGTSQGGGNIFLTLCSSTGSFLVNDGTSFQLTGLQLIEGNEYTGHIPTYGTSVTRSANSFEFTDLVTKRVVGANGEFSFLFNFQNYLAGGLSGDRASSFFDSSNDEILDLWGVGNGYLLRDRKSNITLFGSVSKTSAIITFDGQTLKFYDVSGLIGSYDFVSSHITTKWQFRASDNYCEIKGGSLAFAPTVLTEAQAIAALNEL